MVAQWLFINELKKNTTITEKLTRSALKQNKKKKKNKIMYIIIYTCREKSLKDIAYTREQLLKHSYENIFMEM